MAAINSNQISLLDLARRRDPNGAVAQIVEQLTQRNAILQDSVWKEGNLPTGERVTTRTGLPSVSWRRFNEGIDPSKSRVDQYDEATGMLEGMSQVDCELARLEGNEAAFRASEDVAFMQALNNELETAIFYSSTKTNPEKIMGLSPRLDSTSGNYGSQIIKHDGSASGADQTSIWLVKWGLDAVYCITPKGYPEGIEPHDMGEQLVTDANSKRYRAYVTNWTWKVGLVVKDYRSVVRICNVDVGNLAATGMALIQSMIKAYHQIYQPGTGRLAFYCNRTIGTYLHLQALDSVKNSTLAISNVGGQPITTLLGIPVRETDALLSTESVIT